MRRALCLIAVAFVLVCLGAGCATPEKKPLLDEVELRDSDLPSGVRLKVFPGNGPDMAPISANELGNLTPDHIVPSWIAWDRSGNSQSHVAVFQRRGRVMVALYGNDLASIKPLIPIVAARLAALSATEAGE